MKKLISLIALLGCAGVSNFNVLSTSNDIIDYKPKVLNNFIMLYAGAKREIPLCLTGERTVPIEVNDTYIPFIIHSSRDSASFYTDSCPKEKYLGMAHNHINNLCRMGTVDSIRFSNDSLAIIETIVCKADMKKDSLRIYTAIKQRI